MMRNINLVRKRVSNHFLKLICLLIIFYSLFIGTLNAQYSNNLNCVWGDLSTEPLPEDDIKYIKLNFHVIRNSNGEGNFQDNFMDVRAIKLLVDKANYYLSQNDDKIFWINSEPNSNGGFGNTAPNCANPNNNDSGICLSPLPYSKIRFVLFPIVGDSDDPNEDGIYFRNAAHDNLCFIRGSNYGGVSYEESCPHTLGGTLLSTYSYYNFKKHEDKVLNIFIVNDHPDYLECINEFNSNVINPQKLSDLAYPSPKGYGPGYPDAPFVKIASYYTHYKGLLGFDNIENLGWNAVSYQQECKTADTYSLLLIHEIGHCLGLSHSNSSVVYDYDLPANAPVDNKFNSNNYMGYNPNYRDVFTPSQLSYIHCGLENPNSTAHAYLLQPDEIVHVCGETLSGNDYTLLGNISAENINAEKIESSAVTNIDINDTSAKYEAIRAIKLTPGFESEGLPNEASLKMEIKPDIYFECNEYTIADFGAFSNLTETSNSIDKGFHVGPGFYCQEDLSDFRLAGVSEKFDLGFTCAHASHKHDVHNHHEHLNAVKEIQIFPNPSSDIFNIIVGEETVVEEYSLYNSNGEQIKLFSRKDFSGKLNLSNYPTGIYFLHIKTGEEVFVERIILSK